MIDSGIRYTHEDLASNMWNNPEATAGDLHGWNAYANNGDPMDVFGHGTHCAGAIGAVGDNGIGICGIAWKVQLMACKFINDDSGGAISDEIVCIDYAIHHGSKIFNCSFGQNSYVYCEFDAFNRARTAGVIAVCGAGNENSNNDTIPFYPASYPLDNIVSVAATSYNDGLVSMSNCSIPNWWGSNYGAKTVHLAAPGDQIYSTWGGTTASCYVTFDGAGDSAYAYMSGTSAAAPFVTGAFALMMAQFPNEPYNSLIARLLAVTDKIPSLQGKTIIGGRLNIAKALGYVAPPTPWYEYDSHRTWNAWGNSLS